MAPYVQQTKNPVQIAGSGVHPTREGVVPGGPLSLLHPPKPTAVARPLVVRLSVGSGMSLEQILPSGLSTQAGRVLAEAEPGNTMGQRHRR